MNKVNRRKTYTKEFKLEAVRLAEETNLPYSQLAKDLGITDALLYKWRLAFGKDQGNPFKNETSLDPKQQELKHLKLELLQVKEERDVLKKAVAFFAKQSR